MYVIRVVSANHVIGYVSPELGFGDIRRTVQDTIDRGDHFSTVVKASEMINSIVDEGGILSGNLIGNWVVVHSGPYEISVIELVPTPVSGTLVVGRRA